MVAVVENFVGKDVRALRIDWNLSVEINVMSKEESIAVITVVVEQTVVDWNPIQGAHAI